MGGETALLSVARPVLAGRTVIVCALSPRERARITDAVRGRASLQTIDTFDSLRRVLRTSIEMIECVVLPYRDATGQDSIATIREIVVGRPRVAVVAYCDGGAKYGTDIRALAGAGVHQFVFAGIDDTGVTLRAILESARQHCAADNVMQQLASLVPPKLHSMLEAALSKPDQVVTVTALAERLGVARATVFSRCKQACSIGPEELLTWARIALAAHFLETTGCTIETIARELSFPSDVSFRNTIKRYCGLRASEVRIAGGVSVVARALQQRLTGPPKTARS
jgi:methylphosphotriester-DNA--protein-cysteine methyltransferase